MRDLQYWLAFNSLGLGTVRFRAFERAFASLEDAWRAPANALEAAGVEPKLAAKIVAQRTEVDPQAELDRVQRLGIHAITWRDADFPARLKEIPDPPPVIYIKGTPAWDSDRCMAVVGTRAPTHYGIEAARALSSDLARLGMTIVSGLARGIDAVAHRATIEAGGRTVAIMGSGIDVIYPPEHKELAEAVTQHGALVSELPPGTRPSAQFFPRRNRLLSGMSLGVLVVEAGEKSGALWTVRHALDQNREVFCVPGSVFSPASQSTNRLIQDGAKLVMDYRDILDELGLEVVTTPETPRERRPATATAKPAPSLGEMPAQPAVQLSLAPDQPLPPATPAVVSGPIKGSHGEGPRGTTEDALLQHLSNEPMHIDEVRRLSGLPIAMVSGALALLELTRWRYLS